MRQNFTSKLLLLNLLVSPFRRIMLFKKIIIRLSRLKNNSCKSPLTLCNVWHFHFPATARVNNMFYYSQRQAPARTLKLIITSEGMWWTFFTVYCKSIILLRFLQVLTLKTTNFQVNSWNGFLKFGFLK